MLYLFNHLRQATIYSWQGLTTAYRLQWIFRWEIFTFMVALPLSIFLGKTQEEKLLLIASVLLILIIELINSAIETAIDRISLDQHELSGQAKDLGSAAVFLTVINALIIWVAILAQRILQG